MEKLCRFLYDQGRSESDIWIAGLSLYPSGGIILKKIKALFLVILTVAVLITAAYPAHAFDKDILISDYVEEFSLKTKCSAVSVAIVQDGGSELIGDTDGLYQIGSLTKAFTGLGIQKLIGGGIINEDDKVSKWLPGFTAYYGSDPFDITIEQLLTHTSGYTNKEVDYPSAQDDMTLMEWADSINGRRLSFEPGTRYAYSNVNYNLLGAVIESASGISYKEYMETEVLLPLGLKNTYVEVLSENVSIIPGSRLGYLNSFAYEIPVVPGKIPAGYFYSNAKDMARWLQIWMGIADIPDEYKDLVNRVKENLGDSADYYSGWELFESGTIGHSGGTPNYSSRIVFSDKRQIGVCVLTNMNVAASTDSLCDGIYTLCDGGNSGNIQMDVWTVFDMIFTFVTVVGILLIVFSICIKKRSALIVTELVLIILLIAICVMIPMIFGAELGTIIITWAPYSFIGGLLMLCAAIISIAIKLWIIK